MQIRVKHLYSLFYIIYTSLGSIIQACRFEPAVKAFLYCIKAVFYTLIFNERKRGNDMRLKRVAIGFVIISMMAVCLSLVSGAPAQNQNEEKTIDSSLKIK